MVEFKLTLRRFFPLPTAARFDTRNELVLLVCQNLAVVELSKVPDFARTRLHKFHGRAISLVSIIAEIEVGQLVEQPRKSFRCNRKWLTRQAGDSGVGFADHNGF